MNIVLRLKVATVVRVRDWLLAHPFEYEPADQVVRAFVEKVGRSQVLLTQEEAGEMASRASTRHRKGLRQQILQGPIRHLLKIGKAVSATHPEIASGLEQPVFGKSEVGFLTGVRAIEEVAVANRAIFVQHGMSEEVLTHLDALLAEYDKGIQDANASRRAHTGANAELRVLARELMQVLRQLDAIVNYRFRDKPELLGAWASARNIAWPLGEPVKPETPAKGKEPAA